VNQPFIFSNNSKGGRMTGTIREWLSANASKYPNREDRIKRCMDATGSSRKSVLRKMNEMPVVARTQSKTQVSDDDGTFDFETFKAEHDYKGAIKRTILSNLAGTTKIIPDRTMRELALVPTSVWEDNAEDKQFAAFRITIPGRGFHWADKPIRKAMREELIKGGHDVED
jgi:hypothetical protein